MDVLSLVSTVCHRESITIMKFTVNGLLNQENVVPSGGSFTHQFSGIKMNNGYTVSSIVVLA